MKRRPRKVIVTVLIFLLLGAIVNVGVAWGLELREPMNLMAMLASAPCGYEWQSTNGYSTWLDARTGQLRITQIVRTAGRRSVESALVVRLREPISRIESIGLVPSWSAFSDGEPTQHHVDPLQPDLMLSYSEHSSGWPVLALRHTCVSRNVQTFASGPQEYIDHCDGVVLPERWRTTEHRALPIRPIWPGFAINTLFYAAMLWLLFAAPFALRRRLRIKRGLCPACAYPIGTSDLCTECGKPVNQPQPRTPSR